MKIDLATRYGLLYPHKQEQPATEENVTIYKRHTEKRNAKSVSNDKRARKRHKRHTSCAEDNIHMHPFCM